MLRMMVKATDLASIHELHGAALGHGMFYRGPYRAARQILGAEGTLFTVSGNSLVACTMATRNRMIIHAGIPCTNMKTNDGALFAMEAPKKFDRVLRRFGSKMLALTVDGSRLEIVLPRPSNARGMISLPLDRVKGRMLSVACEEVATTLCLDADPLIAALHRVPRGKDWHLLALQPTDEGFNFQYPVEGAAASECLPATTLERGSTPSPFVCSARSVAALVRVLKSFRKQGPTIRVQISPSRLAVWNDAVTVQFFADRSPSDWRGPSMPDTNTDSPEIQLLLDRRMAEIPKEAGKWLRRLVRTALANGEKTETTWILSHDCVVVELDCGLSTSFEMPCACDCWPLTDDHVSLSVSPLTTAAILECFEKGSDGCRLVYQDTLLTVRSCSLSYALIAQGILNKSPESVRLYTTDVDTTGTAMQAVPTHERGKQTC